MKWSWKTVKRMISKEIFHIHHIHSYPTSHSFSLPSSKTHHVSSGGNQPLLPPMSNGSWRPIGFRLLRSLDPWEPTKPIPIRPVPRPSQKYFPNHHFLRNYAWLYAKFGKVHVRIGRMSTFIAHLKFTWTRVFHAATIHPKLKYLHISWFIHIIHHHPVHSQTRRA